MNTPTSFRLPEEVLDQLGQLAQRYQKTNVAVLIHLIKDRFSSSQTNKNRERRNLGWIEFCKMSGVENTEQNKKIWFTGYSKGWMDFQTRHGENDFRLHFDE
jgi:hypothetical protein